MGDWQRSAEVDFGIARQPGADYLIDVMNSRWHRGYCSTAPAGVQGVPHQCPDAEAHPGEQAASILVPGCRSRKRTDEECPGVLQGVGGTFRIS